MKEIPFIIHEPYPGWLDEFVTTSEASQITGVPEPSLVTLRSRGGGADFVKPIGTRLVRYQRRALFEWMFSGGVLHQTLTEPNLLNAINDNEGEV